jgi:hypothetical protein
MLPEEAGQAGWVGYIVDIRKSDNADVRLTEPLCDGGVTSVTEGDETIAADSRTNLLARIRLCDSIAEVEEPSTHCVEFCIAQFTHFTHDYLLVPNVAGTLATLTLGK